jgi:transcriptional regulator GlxA family with amidase domain
MAEQRLIFALFPGCETLDVAGPLQTFHEANRCGAHYRIVVAGTLRDVGTAQTLGFSRLTALPSVGEGDLVVVPGFDVRQSKPPRELRTWLRRNAASGADFCGVCTGAFAFGEAAMLDGRRCTTHWKRIGELARRFPRARVVDDTLFVTDGPITTSAGAASGIDIALWYVERHYGPLVAARTAREMVVHTRREGSHAQQSFYLNYRAHLNSAVHRVQDFIIGHPSEKVRLPDLAKLAGMSARSMTRAFRLSTGVSIAEYRQHMRLENAKMLLRQPGVSIDRIAAQVGFEDPRQLRRLWRQRFGAPPSKARARK